MLLFSRETPGTAACQASLSFTISQSLLKLMSNESLMPSNHLILCRPLLLLPSIFPSIRISSNELTLRIKWPKYWSSSFTITPSNIYSGLISFRVDWLDLLGVQGTLKSLLEHLNLKASIIPRSVFFIVQLSHPYKATGKTIALTIWTFIGKVMSLLFNMLSKFVIAFLPRSKRLLISLLQSLSTVIFGAQENKSLSLFPHLSLMNFPIYLAIIIVFQNVISLELDCIQPFHNGVLHLVICIKVPSCHVMVW